MKCVKCGEEVKPNYKSFTECEQLMTANQLAFTKSNQLEDEAEYNGGEIYAIVETTEELSAQKSNLEQYKIKNLDITTDGHKEIYLGFQWDGPFPTDDYQISISLLDCNKKWINGDFIDDQRQELLFTIESNALKLLPNKVNPTTFYVEFNLVHISEDFTETSKLNEIKGPFNVNIYYESKIFGKNILEIRK